MYRHLSLLLLATSFQLSVVIYPLNAQSGCFMQGQNGQTIDLGGLCGNTTPSATPTRSRGNMIQLPIKRRVSGIPTVDITFNGNKTFEMLFDTGASGITITPSMAEAMNVKPERTSYAQTAGGVVPIALGRVQSVSAGGLVIKDIPVSINPSHSLDLGLLGQSFFGSYDVTIKEKVIELRRR
ncbi:MAG: TIGR02281 family clan AA aspartic protease [Microcystaceae cyanobacterium]